MKNKKDILTRAIVLLCVSDRSFLEAETLGSKSYTCEQREEQRNRIYSWLKKTGYLQYMTQQEITLFEEAVGGFNSTEIFNCRFQYEAIVVLLWALGLRDMPNYSCFLEEDFHDILKIGTGHNLDILMNTCQLRPEEEIALQTEVAMLWHWRAIEMGQVPKDGKSWSDCIKLIFGDEYEAVLRHIPQASQSPHDFLVGETPVSKLNKTEQGMLDIIAYWRHHAFEWIMSDDAWDEVSADT